jgi:hypothetical protein
MRICLLHELEMPRLKKKNIRITLKYKFVTSTKMFGMSFPTVVCVRATVLFILFVVGFFAYCGVLHFVLLLVHQPSLKKPPITKFVLHEIKVWYLNCRFPCSLATSYWKVAYLSSLMCWNKTQLQYLLNFR